VSLALNFSWARELARSMERTRINSAIADCVYALARTSQADACASRIVRCPAPRVRRSASLDRRGALTKSGSAYLRTALIESAQIAVRKLNQFQREAERKIL
jgi:Transposase IS116/IS110/IS902 family